MTEVALVSEGYNDTFVRNLTPYLNDGWQLYGFQTTRGSAVSVIYTALLTRRRLPRGDAAGDGGAAGAAGAEGRAGAAAGRGGNRKTHRRRRVVRRR
jgi:hypothetical protein